jgi:hypothetical protein
MTCVVYSKGKVYADSLIIKDGEHLHSMTKINELLAPPHVKSDKPGFVIDDTIYGWIGSGGLPAMSQFAKKLEEMARAATEEKPADFESYFEFYKAAVSQNLVVGQGNLFDIFMIGEKMNHMFSFTYRGGFTYEAFDKEMSMALGSGHRLWMNFYQDHKDPIRAMLETFFVDENSGGMIDVWETGYTDKKEGEEPHFFFRREGVIEIPKKMIRYYLDKVRPHQKGLKIPLQLVRRQRLNAAVRAAAEDQEQMMATIEKRDETIKQLEAKLARYEKRLGIGKKKPAAKKVAVKKAAPAVAAPAV